MTTDERGISGTGTSSDLRSAGLIRRVAPVEGDRRTTLVTLTERGRELLERHRTHDRASATALLRRHRRRLAS